MLITSFCLIVAICFLGGYALPRINLSVGGNVNYKPVKQTISYILAFNPEYQTEYYCQEAYGLWDVNLELDDNIADLKILDILMIEDFYYNGEHMNI